MIISLEEGGDTKAGVYARDGSTGSFVTIVEGGPNSNGETTGLAFCDDGRRMMFAFQEEGKVFEIMVSLVLPIQNCYEYLIFPCSLLTFSPNFLLITTER